MGVRQVVVTFFNRRFDNVFSKALDESWLHTRWDLFQKYTVASLRNETVQNFDWVVPFHERSPEWLRVAARRLSLPCRVHLSFDQGPINGLATTESLQNDVFLVTRLDSDDGLHALALERIAKAFARYGEEFDAYGFEVGYQYDERTQRLALMNTSSPPFGTRVYFPPVRDPVDSGPEHHRWPDLFRYKDISCGDPIFLQVVHRSNLANRIVYTSSPIARPLSRRILKEAFNIEVPAEAVPARLFASDLIHLLWQVRRTRQ